ncbi:MAG: hypothetical protein WC862_02645 [Patescibacteria group bacterium]
MLNKQMLIKSIFYGLLAGLLLITFYFSLITFVSGWNFAREQFFQYWYYLISLTIGFGVQICLYVYLKNVVHNQRGSGKVLAVSGATSTVAMISCCAHYLVNILPVLGIAGAISIVAQYQIELFWAGLVFNLGGIIFIARRLFKFQKSV